ncbi:hypothetical protein [Spiroplasma cantharicola]|uniref:Uncharacterized protein n=1 Tax=Spiroplasma cantharicola TaxID=362837 RepID=A0A0M5KEI6_9MOLU|nr:hypothetical protein [Spiroplasma cantharicola]ALD66501.1 hypothetical protein SCANT_v1c05950 [Spiroplasma cantharicola]
MEKISEKEVSQKTFLNGKPWYWWARIVLILLSIILFIILIWGFAFKGFLYVEYKNKTIKYYNQIVLQEENDKVCKELDYTSEKFVNRCNEFVKQRNSYYDYQKDNKVIIKYINIYEIESLSSKSFIIFSVTNNYFEDIRYKDGDNQDDSLMSSIFFIYRKDSKNWYLEDLLFQFKDIEKLGDYK